MEWQVKRSVALAIRDGDRVLVVQRPADDDELPNAWGLPAASLRDDETWTDVAARIGQQKLGVTLDVAGELGHDSIERTGYTLEMRLFEATIASGQPHVPQDDVGVTQYQQWKWGSADDLRPAAARGSLCCKLYLASL